MDRTILTCKEFVRNTAEMGPAFVEPVTDTIEMIYDEMVRGERDGRRRGLVAVSNIERRDDCRAKCGFSSHSHCLLLRRDIHALQ